MQRVHGCEGSARLVAISPAIRDVAPNLPWEYRHFRAFGVTRIAGASVAAAAGIACLSYGVYGWAAFFLAVGALNLAWGYWDFAIARSPSSRT